MRSWSKPAIAFAALAATVFGLQLAALGQAARPGNPDRGRGIAAGWCADCHALAADGPGKGAPSFAAIAERFADDTEILAAIIAYPHPPMRNIGLKREDVGDMLAFIDSLRSRR